MGPQQQKTQNQHDSKNVNESQSSLITEQFFDTTRALNTIRDGFETFDTNHNARLERYELDAVRSDVGKTPEQRASATGVLASYDSVRGVDNDGPAISPRDVEVLITKISLPGAYPGSSSHDREARRDAAPIGAEFRRTLEQLNSASQTIFLPLKGAVPDLSAKESITIALAPGATSPTQLSEEVIAGLQQAHQLKHLVFEHVSYSNLTEPQLLEVRKVFERVSELQFREANDFVKLLGTSEQLPQLRSLSVASKTSLNQDLKLDGATELKSLEIVSPTSDSRCLVSVGRLEKLELLRLELPKLQDEGFESLGQLSELKFLNLEGSGVTGSGLAQLKHLPISHLNLACTNFQSAHVDQLRELQSLQHFTLHRAEGPSAPKLEQRHFEKLTWLPSLQCLTVDARGLDSTPLLKQGIAVFTPPHLTD